MLVTDGYKNMLVFENYKHKIAAMMIETHTSKRPTGLSAGRAFLCAEASHSGLVQRAYPSPDLWASKPLAGSRPFESDRFHHHQSSGADGVGALSTPDHHSGDEPEATTVLRNIRLGGRICQSRESHPFNPKDELREQPFPRKAD
jgi:hypothetical protein